LRTDEGSKIGSRDTGGSERKDLKEEKDPLYSVVRTLTELDVKEVRQGELLRHVLLWHLLQTRSDAVIATLTDLLALSVSPEEEAGSAEANKVATASSETKLVRKKRKRASSSLTKAPPRSEVQLRTIRALSICEFCHFVASARHDSTQMSLNAVRALRSHTSLKQTLVLVPSLLGSDRFSQLRTWFNGGGDLQSGQHNNNPVPHFSPSNRTTNPNKHYEPPTKLDTKKPRLSRAIKDAAGGHTGGGHAPFRRSKSDSTPTRRLKKTGRRSRNITAVQDRPDDDFTPTLDDEEEDEEICTDEENIDDELELPPKKRRSNRKKIL
jgi:hypothetical protein